MNTTKPTLNRKLLYPIINTAEKNVGEMKKEIILLGYNLSLRRKGSGNILKPEKFITNLNFNDKISPSI